MLLELTIAPNLSDTCPANGATFHLLVRFQDVRNSVIYIPSGHVQQCVGCANLLSYFTKECVLAFGNNIVCCLCADIVVDMVEDFMLYAMIQTVCCSLCVSPQVGRHIYMSMKCTCFLHRSWTGTPQCLYAWLTHRIP